MDTIEDMQQSKLGWGWTKGHGSEMFAAKFLCLFCVYFLLFN